MGEQVDAKLLKQVKRTQDLLGKYIKRPPLTDKNLMRPPFRFLHDLIMAATSNSTFLKGVLATKELDAANLTTRELKTAFMTKVVQAIKDASGEEVDAKVSKILAGQEADKTNELLQALAKVLEQSSQGEQGNDDAPDAKVSKAKKVVAKTPAAKTKDEVSPYGKKPTAANAKVPAKAKPSDKDKRRGSTIRDPSPNIKPAPTKGKPNAAPAKGRPSQGQQSKDKQKKQPVSASGDDGGASFAMEVEEDLEEAQEISIPPPAVAGSSSATTRSGSSDRIARESDSATIGTPTATSGSKSAMSTTRLATPLVTTAKREAAEDDNPVIIDSGGDTAQAVKKSPVRELTPSAAPSSKLLESPSSPTVLIDSINDNEHEHDKSVTNENDNGFVVDETTFGLSSEPSSFENLKPFTPPMPSSALNSRRRPPSSFGGLSLAPVAEDNQATTTDETSAIPATARPHTSQFRASRPPTSTRPPSARPAPPRPKSARFQEKEESFRPPTGRVANVLLDSDEPDDENYIVHESTTVKAGLTDLDEAPELDLGSSLGLKMDESIDTLLPPDQRGLLVNQILETQKELEEGGRVKKTEIERDPLMEDKDKMKIRENNGIEVEKLRNLIQMTAKSANPLGKLLDFIREDADSMHREMKKWQDESRVLDKMITAEQEKTQNSLEPLNQHLQDIDNKIQDQEDAIAATKMTILRQEERIRKILVGLDRVKPRGINDPIPTSADLQQMVTKFTVNDYPLFKPELEEPAPKRVYRSRTVSDEPEPQRTYPGVKEVDPSELDFLRY